MARPSRGIDQSLLASGLDLYPQLGCAALSVRRVAEHAGANPAMFHYHFANKVEFLRTLLQQVYETLFARLSAGSSGDGPALARLRATLLALTAFAHDNRRLLGRLLLDAASGEAVVHDFLRANVPRHLRLILQLLDEAEREGDLRPMARLQRIAFLMGAIGAPLLGAAIIVPLHLPPADVMSALDAQVLSRKAVAERIDLALAALQAPTPPVAEALPGRAARRPRQAR